jgi:hypothetical protein
MTFVFDKNVWEEKGNLMHLISAQGTLPWKEQRQMRLTSSKFAAAIGDSKFCTPKQLARRQAGLEEEEFTDEAIERMRIGSEGEKGIIIMYTEKTGRIVKECSLYVNKEYPHLGFSPDGDCDDGTVEVKNPEKVYPPLLKRKKDIENGKKFSKYNHDHIYKTHYAQMQGVMWQKGTTWVDYIVYGWGTGELYIERVYYNENYCKNKLEYGIDLYYSTYFEDDRITYKKDV